MAAVRFPLGQVVATPGALAALAQSRERPEKFLTRHQSGDWGDLCEEDCSLNKAALVNGSRLLSAYQTANGTRVWIITEAEDDKGIRRSTCILLPEDY